MADSFHGCDGRERLESLESALRRRAEDLAVFFVFDRPELASERPGLSRTYFAERCAPDSQIEGMLAAVRAIGAQAELFEGDHKFLAALAAGHHKDIDKELQIAYNGLGYSVGADAFEPGRKSLIPLVADSYGLVCANSDAYACAFTLHKFHCFTLLDILDIRVPRTWHYRREEGWMKRSPPMGAKVIVKSTYESWSVGVTDRSVFLVDEDCERRVAEIAESISQDVTVQDFIAGREVYVPVFSCPKLVVSSPVESVLSRAPDDPDAVVTIEDSMKDEGVSYRLFDADPDLGDDLRSLALEVFRTLRLRGFARIDFRIDEDDQPWVIDVAVSPGVGPTGAGSTSLADYGFDYPSFIRLVIAATLGTKGLLAA